MVNDVMMFECDLCGDQEPGERTSSGEWRMPSPEWHKRASEPNVHAYTPECAAMLDEQDGKDVTILLSGSDCED